MMGSTEWLYAISGVTGAVMKYSCLRNTSNEYYAISGL